MMPGFEVVAQAGDAVDLRRKVRAHRPDVAVVDIQMPPTNTDDGLRAAILIRSEHPETKVLVLSQYVEERYAVDLIGESAAGVGYLLKHRVGDVDAFADAIRQRGRGRLGARSRGRLARCSTAAAAPTRSTSSRRASSRCSS